MTAAEATGEGDAGRLEGTARAARPVTVGNLSASGWSWGCMGIANDAGSSRRAA